MLLFSTSYSKQLTKNISKLSKVRIGRLEIARFADGEIYLKLKEEVKEKNCIVIASLPNAESLLELIFLIDLLKSEGAKTIRVIIPYLCYTREDRKIEKEAFTSKVIIGILNSQKIDRLDLIDLHSERIKKFFKLPVFYNTAVSLFVDKFDVKNPVLVAPDWGAIRMVKNFSKISSIKDFAFIRKIRGGKDIVKKMELEGNVKNRNILILDDIIDTGGTILMATDLLKKNGAKDIYVAAAHGLFSGNCAKNLEKSVIKKIIVTDTLEKKIKSEKISILSVAPLFRKCD